MESAWKPNAICTCGLWIQHGQNFQNLYYYRAGREIHDVLVMLSTTMSQLLLKVVKCLYNRNQQLSVCKSFLVKCKSLLAVVLLTTTILEQQFDHINELYSLLAKHIAFVVIIAHKIALITWFFTGVTTPLFLQSNAVGGSWTILLLGKLSGCPPE